MSIHRVSILRLRWDFIPAVGAAVRFFKPLLNAMISKDVLALWQPQRVFTDAFGSLDSIVVIADHAG